jgi:hypothetical protein
LKKRRVGPTQLDFGQGCAILTSLLTSKGINMQAVRAWAWINNSLFETRNC